MLCSTSEWLSGLSPGGDAFWLGGGLVTIRVPGELTGNALAIVEFLVPADFVAPRQLHHVEDVILFVLEGEIAARCGNERLSGGPGVAFFLPRGIAHTWWAAGEAGARLLMVTTPAGYERYCAEAGVPAPERILPDGAGAAARAAALRAAAPRYGIELEPAGE